MRISAEFEQDTVVFYEMLEPFVEDPQSRRISGSLSKKKKDTGANFKNVWETRFEVPGSQ